MKYKGVLIESISIFKTPATYLELTLLLIVDVFAWLKSFVVRRVIPIVVATAIWLMISNIDALQVDRFRLRLFKISATLQVIGSF